MVKVNRKLVVCVGAQKAATTTLFKMMQKHPEVCTTIEKETGFFYQDVQFSKGCEWFFDSCFPADRENKECFFEADPNYLYFERCIDRIFSCDPAAQIIVMLRDPVDRAFSHYLMMKKWGLDRLSFEDAVKNK